MSLRLCPRAACSELNNPDAIVCHQCGARLTPSKRMLERWMRVRAATHTAATVDADRHADMIVADLERRQGAQPWPSKDAA